MAGMPTWVLVLHLAATAALAGIGWLTHLALYPLFRLVGTAEWTRYHRAHTRALGRVVALPWLAQGTTTVGLLVAVPDGISPVLVWVDAGLAAAAVLVTALRAVPLHGRLATGQDGAAITALLRADLARSLVWTAGVGTAAALVLLAG